MSAHQKDTTTVSQWWLQRISAVIVAAYLVLLIVLLLVHGTPNWAQWQALFANGAFKAFTLLAMAAAFYHGLIGALHVWPDYVKHRGVLATLNAYAWLAACAYMVWGAYILFGMK